MIGLIFGETDFPKQILKKIKKKEKYLIIDLTKTNVFKKDRNSYPVSIGQFGKIINILKKYNCKKVLFAGKVNKPNFSKLKLDLKGIYSKIRPNIQNKKDINNSIKVLTKTRPYSYSQGAVSRDNKVIAIEGEGGTQKMLKNIKNKGNGVLVKFPKKKQDMRVDLPTIGLNTLKQCKKAGLKGIVLKHKKNILLDKKKCIQYANKNKIFILVK